MSINKPHDLNSDNLSVVLRNTLRLSLFLALTSVQGDVHQDSNKPPIDSGYQQEEFPIPSEEGDKGDDDTDQSEDLYCAEGQCEYA